MTQYNDVPFVPSQDCSRWEECQMEAYKQGRVDEYNRIIGFLKYNRFAIVDNNGDYYSIEELEDMLRGQSDENNV